MPAFFKDKALDAAENKGNNNSTVNEIDDTKEREGVYPNKLDEEMQGYEYGDKVRPYGYGYGNYGNYGNYDNNYRYNTYSNIYDKNSGVYNKNNKWDKHNGWGFKDGDIAPKFDPNSHF